MKSKKPMPKPRVLGVTLARSGSKGVPNKNGKNLGGRPLIAHTIHEAMRSLRISEYVVSTESESLRGTALRYGAWVPFLRPVELASDTASSVSALQHAVDWVEHHLESKFDYVVELMTTNPLKNAEDIDACLDLLMSSGADSVIAVNELGDAHPARAKRLVDGKIQDFCVPEPIESRRQDLLPKAFIRSGAIYAMKRDELMVHGRRYGSSNSLGYVLPAERVVNIDTEVDWLVAEAMLAAGRT